MGSSPAFPILHSLTEGQPLLFLGLTQWGWEKIWTGIKKKGKFFGPFFLLLGTMSPTACPLACKFEGFLSHGGVKLPTSCLRLKVIY